MLKALLGSIRSFFITRSGDPKERRRVVRVRSVIPVQLKIGSNMVSATVTDMGVKGMRVRLGVKMSSGSRVPVLYAGQSGTHLNQVVFCKVAWSRRLRGEKRFSAGLVYDDQPTRLRHSWVAWLLRELGLDERTIHERREFVRAQGRIQVKADWIEPRDEPPPAMDTLNMGVGGLLLRSRGALPEATQLDFTLGPYEGLPTLTGLRGEVRSCSLDQAHNTFTIAIRFLDLEAEQVRALGKILLKLIKEA